MPETGMAAVRMNEALSAEKFRSSALEKRLFAFLAEQYRGKGDVAHLEEGLSPAGVRDLADAIAAVCGGRAVVLSGSDGNFSVCILHPGGDVKDFANAMKQALNGRGGGKPGTFQGTLNTTKAQIKEFFKM
jgi:alanyl-tRNA synthetase